MQGVKPLKMLTKDVAALVHGTIIGEQDRAIVGVQSIDQATKGDATFLHSEQYLKVLPKCNAGLILVSKRIFNSAATEFSLLTESEQSSPTLVIVEDAYRAFVVLMHHFHPAMQMQPGLRHPTATIDETAAIHESASIGPGCVIGAHCTIAEQVMIYANVTIYDNVTIGSSTIIHANVVLAQNTHVGTNCLIHAGAVLGADGFGFIENTDGSFSKVPQVGNVVLGDDVEVGSNTTIDRAAIGTTYIGNGVKLDNLVHIAHGVHISENTAIAAQAGVSGSTTLGKRNRIAGQVGIVGHITTIDDVIVEAQSGLSKNVTVAGRYFGSPAVEHRSALRMEAAFRQLPDLLREVQKLKAEICELKEKMHE